MAQNQYYMPSTYQPITRPMYYETTQPQYAQVPIPLGLKGRPVSSLEEVRATAIDFDGTVFYFPDLANKKIYTKQINLDGTASLNMYELKNITTPNEQNNMSNSSYITREEFESVINNIKEQQQVLLSAAMQANTQVVPASVPQSPSSAASVPDIKQF